MTSQYDIEQKITHVNKLRRHFDHILSNYDDGEFKQKELLKLTKQIKKEEKKLSKWCKDFDEQIKPLTPLNISFDKIYRITIPLTQENHMKYVKEFTDFIYKDGYKVEGMDKQKGYMSIVYSLFTVKK